MILDSFSLDTLTFMVGYSNAFELWDRAGAISRKLSNIWPGVDIVEAKPHEQLLRNENVTLHTGITKSVATINSSTALDQLTAMQLTKSVEAWKTHLEISKFNRVSTKVRYQKLFPSIQDANEWIFSLNLVRRPTEKVFDQPIEAEKHAVAASYRFEDSASFVLIDLKSEQINFEFTLDKNYVDQPNIKGVKNRVIIDFDRGILGDIQAENFRVDEWLKGFQHLLRRDLDKVIGGKNDR